MTKNDYTKGFKFHNVFYEQKPVDSLLSLFKILSLFNII